MGTTKARAARRQHLRDEYQQKVQLKGGAGYGLPQEGAIPAGGQRTTVNPVMQPKQTGLNVTSLTFPSNYYQTWDLAAWRNATEQARRMGYPIQYAAMTTWVFTKSAFVQSLFREIEVALENSPVFLFDQKGNKIEEWSQEICAKSWFNNLRKEIALANFWGFSGLNFDPFTNQTYKYPQQDIDPINRYLRQSTYNLYDGTYFSDIANLLFVQPSTNYERFLGWMEPICHEFIRINMNNDNWVAAGKRLAFPIMQVGYPENSTGLDANEDTINPYKTEAENIIKNVDPTNGLVYPYTRNADGTVNKSIEIDFATGMIGNQNAHAIFKDFNESQKEEIRQMILLSTLTSQVGERGSLALGEVHEAKYDKAIASVINWHIDELNKDFLNKVLRFYRNFPKNSHFGTNKVKQYKLDEIVQISDVLTQNGKRLSTTFFIDQGLSPDYIEDQPQIQPEITNKKEPEAELASKPSLFSLKKKL